MAAHASDNATEVGYENGVITQKNMVESIGENKTYLTPNSWKITRTKNISFPPSITNETYKDPNYYFSGTSYTVSATVNWYWKIFYGAATSKPSTNPNPSGSSKDVGNGGVTLTIDCSGGKYPVLFFPKTWWGSSGRRVTSGGFDFSDYTIINAAPRTPNEGRPIPYLAFYYNYKQSGIIKLVIE